MMRNALIFVGVFLVATITDICWTRFNQAVAAQRPHLAGFWSLAIGLWGSISVLAYTNEHWTLAPLCMGYYFGTWLAVRKAPANGNK
jgi:hypothetical protein